MLRKKQARVIIFLLFLSLSVKSAFAQTEAVEYLCAFGVNLYRTGRYEDALSEFNKVLLIDPSNRIAKRYVDNIFTQGKPAAKSEAPAAKTLPLREQGTTRAEKPPSPQSLVQKPKAKPDREQAIDKILTGLKKKEPAEKPKASLSGEYRLGLGFTSKDIIWKDANADRVGVPREKNWRYLWGDKRHNTYDPKIYDRLTVDVNTNPQGPLNTFMEVTADPWTFIGKNHVTIGATAGGDVVDMDLKYWSADSRTINEIYRSKNGNIINLRQIKVDSGKTSIATPTGLTDWGTAYNAIQPSKVNRDYRPFRKFWVEYKQDDYSFKVFPISDQFEALTSDDPLRISNNHVYWEENPWLDEYEASRNFESPGYPIKKGRWIRRMSFFTKDSSDDYPQRLTFLRGASFKSDTGAYSLETTVATPMNLWDKYENSNSAEGAARLKVPVNDALQLGLTTTSKVGFHGGSAEALNQVEGLDAQYKLSEYNTLFAEAAYSYTNIEEAKGFDTTYGGVGAKLGLGYDNAKETKEGIYKGEIFIAYMNNKFYPALSNYRYTRRDESTLSRHIYFADIKDEDKALTWGDGMDRGRISAGFALNVKSLDEKIDSDIRYRNVHDTGKYVESVLRGESTYNVNPRLSSKLLAYYKNQHKTHANEDPLIYAKSMYSFTDYFSEEDIHPVNASVIDGKDPSVGSFGLGAKYDLLEKLLSLEGVYERTNDPLDFPRGLLSDTSVITEGRDEQTWDKVVPFLYDQKFFDQPPYHYYAIAKTKFIYTPAEEWEFILSYTYNENKHASGIDDNINHVGLEANYTPTEKWSLWFKYIYSRLIDVYKQNQFQHTGFFEGHHNVFFGSEYRFNKDESFTFLYGEFVGYDSPYQQGSWTLSALDTQHIFRLFYKRKF